MIIFPINLNNPIMSELFDMKLLKNWWNLKIFKFHPFRATKKRQIFCRRPKMQIATAETEMLSRIIYWLKIRRSGYKENNMQGIKRIINPENGLRKRKRTGQMIRSSPMLRKLLMLFKFKGLQVNHAHQPLALYFRAD